MSVTTQSDSNDSQTTELPLVRQTRKKLKVVLRVARTYHTDETDVTREEIDELQGRVGMNDSITLDERDATVLWAALCVVRFERTDVTDKRFRQLENLMCEMDHELGNYVPGFGA